ncbi:MAG: hypothetical protein IPH04_14890 [Saprospirales bacterium]|nr:hypothetical protein [Saprospirales bacterium]
MSGNLPIYRFTVTIGAELISTTPTWGEDAAIKQTRESGKAYFRPEVVGSFKFMRTDYDAIMAEATLADEIFLTIEEFTGTWDFVGEGVFTLADCDIDEDHRMLTVKLDPNDQYKEILASMDKEFDLVRLAVPRVTVQIATQPVIQIYIPGSSYVNNYLNGTYWEQPVIEPLNEGGTLATMFTGSPFYLFVVMGDGVELDPDISGQYLSDPGAPYFGYTRTDGLYALTYDVGDSLWVIVDYGTGARVYEADASGPTTNPAPGLNWTRDNVAVTFQSLTSASTCRAMFVTLYGRILTNETTVGGDATDPIPGSDIVEDSLNYSRMLALDLTTIIGSSLHDPDAGRYGRFASDAHLFGDEYFVRPVPAGSEGLIYPINRSGWTEASVWFYFDDDLRDLQEDGSTYRFMKDGFYLPDVLAAILAEVDPAITHAQASAYSHFFYGSGNTIRGAVKYPIITPKTNITVGEYDQPASKAPITLGQIFAFLWNFHRVMWYVDSSNRLCLEHQVFFELGKSYSTPGIGTDLLELIEPRTRKPWSYKTNRYRYDKAQLWNIMQFRWMDDVSRPFAGYPIEALAKYVNRGQVMEANLSPFTSDIDFMQVQPATINKDGFAFMEALATETPGIYYLPFVEFEIDSEEQYKMQNGYASLVWAVDAYHRDYLPCEEIKINDREDTANSVMKIKVQELRHPGVIDPMLLVTTSLGDGRVMEVIRSLSTRMNKIKAYHDPI